MSREVAAERDDARSLTRAAQSPAVPALSAFVFLPSAVQVAAPSVLGRSALPDRQPRFGSLWGYTSRLHDMLEGTPAKVAGPFGGRLPSRRTDQI